MTGVQIMSRTDSIDGATERLDVLCDYSSLPAAFQKHFEALEEYIGDTDGRDVVVWEQGHETCVDDGTIDAAEAVRAFNGIVAQVAALKEALETFERCAYPVATSINPRGYNWMPEKNLDYALERARAALTTNGSAT